MNKASIRTLILKFLACLCLFEGNPAGAMTTSEATTLLRNGEYYELSSAIQKSLTDADEVDRDRLKRMQIGLESFLKKQATGPSNPRVIALGGFNNGWHAAISHTSPYGPQWWTIQKEFPESFIKEQWDKGCRISSVAGGSVSWAVVMSYMKDGSKPGQSYWGPGAFGEGLQTWITQKDNEGYKITGVAGFDSQWVVVMTKNTGWGRQRFTLPKPYNREWLDARLREGYHVTAASGDRLVNQSNGSVTDTYVFVVTQGTGFGTWTGYGRATWDEFEPWFREKKKTMAPTALFGYSGTFGAYLAEGTLK